MTSCVHNSVDISEVFKDHIKTNYAFFGLESIHIDHWNLIPVYDIII
jgi:hypothetical protein